MHPIIKTAIKATNSTLILFLLALPFGSIVSARSTPSLQVFEAVEKGNDDAPQDIIVKFRDEENIDQILEENNASQTEVLEQDELFVVEPDGTSTIETLIEDLESNPEVEFAEPNYKREVTVISSNDTFKDLMWGIYNSGQTVNNSTGTVDADMDIDEAWTVTEGDDSIIVAVIDSGVDYTHPDISGSMWDGTVCKNESGALISGGCIHHGYDFENNDNDPLPISFHGTHIAGTIAASKNNSAGTIGVAPQTKIMAIRFGLDVASEVKAINFARENGAKVINASFSGLGYSSAEYAAIQAFQNAGGIFVAAASNDTNDNDVTPYYPGSYNLSGIISVAATDQSDGLASFSNFGDTTVDVGAPGVNIASLVPSNQYGFSSGTSMASPHVAGLTALIMAAYPDLTAAEVKALILNTGDTVSSLSNKTVTGKRVNAYNAVTGLTPHVGSASNDLIATSSITRTTNGSGEITFNFYVKTGLSGISATTTAVEYSLDSGTTWRTAPVGSEFTFNENEFDTTIAYSGTPYVLTWHTLLNASTSATTTNEAMLRFKAATAATSSPYAYTTLFTVDTITPAVIEPAAVSSGGGGGSSGGSSTANGAVKKKAKSSSKKSGGGGGGSSSKKEPAKVAMISGADTVDAGCQPGNLFSTTTGKACTASSVNYTRTYPVTPASPLPVPAIFNRDLMVGAIGEDVRQLQIYLNTHGYSVAVFGMGSLGQEGMYFGALTQAALIRFQTANGIVPATGYFGASSRALMH